MNQSRMPSPAILVAALALVALALGALGLVACGDGDDDQTTAASETTSDEPAADNKSCGRFDRYQFAVVNGDVSCRVAQGVMRANSIPRKMPGSWSCSGPDALWVCINEAGETIVAWCCGTDQQEAMKLAGQRE